MLCLYTSCILVVYVLKSIKPHIIWSHLMIISPLILFLEKSKSSSRPSKNFFWRTIEEDFDFSKSKTRALIIIRTQKTSKDMNEVLWNKKVLVKRTLKCIWVVPWSIVKCLNVRSKLLKVPMYSTYIFIA